MVRRSSRPKPKDLAKQYPNIVEIEVPPQGFGVRLMVLHQWLRLRGCAHAHWVRLDISNREKGPTDYTFWGFVHDDDARAFQEFWSQIEHMDQRVLHRLSEQQKACENNDRPVGLAPASKQVTVNELRAALAKQPMQKTSIVDDIIAMRHEEDASH